MKIVDGVPETTGYTKRQMARRKPARKPLRGPGKAAKTPVAEEPPEEHRCVNDGCRKLLTGRRKNTKFCSPRCRDAVKAKEREEAPEQWISQACRYPAQQQAELVRSDMRHRHPYAGKRPHRYSGYCVIPRCECKCHPWNQIEEEEADD